MSKKEKDIGESLTIQLYFIRSNYVWAVFLSSSNT